MSAERKLPESLRNLKARHWIALGIIAVFAISGLAMIRQGSFMAKAAPAALAADRTVASTTPSISHTADQPRSVPLAPAPRTVIRPVAPFGLMPVVVGATAPIVKWVVASKRNVRSTPTTADAPVRQLSYGDKILTTGVMMKGQDPYGTGQPDWLELTDGTFVWSEGLMATDPKLAPAPTALMAEDTPLPKTTVMQPHVNHQSGIQQSGGINWAALRQCESSGNYANNDTGHNGHYGAYQFDFRTWASVGGKGNPANASPAEQDMRAQMLYANRGLQPWQCGWAARK